MRANVTVTLKKGVLDPQGNAVMNALNHVNGGEVKNIRIGKLIEIEIAEIDPEKARMSLEGMCKSILSNPVIEDYHIEIIEG